jgi:hypothetical protein
VALTWLLSKPVITAPIVGATKLQHLGDALASVGIKLSEDEIASLEEPYPPIRLDYSDPLHAGLFPIHLSRSVRGRLPHALAHFISAPTPA